MRTIKCLGVWATCHFMTHHFFPAPDYPFSFINTSFAAEHSESGSKLDQPHEERITISPAAAEAAGIKTEIAGPAPISDKVNLTGQIVLNANKTVDVRARFPGVVNEIFTNVGESVKKDQSLIKIESNGTLESYNINAPQDGIIITRNTNIGDVALDKPLFTISDLSTIWAKFHVFTKDISQIKIGDPVIVQTLDERQSANATINFLSPTVDPATQSVLAIAELANNQNAWKAGMIIKGSVLISKVEVPLAVKTSALQKIRDNTVVFAKEGSYYEAKILTLGRSDGEWVEVLNGIKPGTPYVTQNSFVIKSELEKSGVDHDH
ncbi:efflux RND transporter periplasmic adaptor subunit [Candidatus Berkiella aquae]|uniref:Cobalt-zinc-cadmium resistance protein CzcB n=1 Tax=Candidatus Berkiella aquae TaxID=295108 RepID=A0A0Q9YPU0_9GAMM|nr:efflux RND transporter periplasmic adaptor subunit [Candidatus Berkiella aquae]MCS5709893.1 efflux RND transporter periplasmic adaptor subunit [Candidatus Berkiella aquae]